MKAVFILCVSSLSAIVLGQQIVVPGTKPAGSSSPYDASYNDHKRVTVSGQIVGIGIARPEPGMSRNVRLLVGKTGKRAKVSVVELGPEWYVTSQKAHLRLQERVKVTGAQIVEHGQTKIIASQVVGSDKSVITLRRLDGIPYWVGATPPTNSEVAESKPDDSQKLVAQGTILGTKTFTINGVVYSGYVVQTDTGPTNVIVGPVAYANDFSIPFGIGNAVQIFSNGPVITQGPMLPNGVPSVIYASSIYGDAGTLISGPYGLHFFP